MTVTTAGEAYPFDDVLKVAVLRGGGLGDLAFALPAIEALAATYPEAEIVLLGTPAHRELLRGRPGAISRVETLPRARGVNSPDGTDDPGEIEEFLGRMRRERFDLACQLHGGGRFSNPFLRRLEARHTVGTRTADAEPLERSLPYRYFQHEIFRWLESVSLAGARSAGPEPHLSVSRDERLRGLELLGDARGPTVVVHAGASDPRRRWPAERFATVAARMTAEDARVVVIGDGDDAAVAENVVRLARPTAGTNVVSLAGRLTLRELVGVLSVADVVLANDSGPRHIAQAIGTATVGIFSAGNLITSGPLTRERHRVLVSWTTRCPVCSRDATQVGWTAERCPHDVSFVSDVPVDAVAEEVRNLVGLTAGPAHPRGV